MDKLNYMMSFVQVAETGSYTKAAHKLGKTKALMSTHVTQLESHLNVRLLNRSTRGVQLTDTGRIYYEQAKRVLDDISNLENQLTEKNQSIAGRLRITAPTNFGELVLMPFIAAFYQRHPKLDIEIALNDRFVDIVEEGFDLAVRIGQLNDSNLIARKVGQGDIYLCASPSYIKTFGHPKSPEDLRDRLGVSDTNTAAKHPWRCTLDNKDVDLPIISKINVNGAVAAANLAAASDLICRCPSFAAQDLIAQGKLVRLLPTLHFQHMPIQVVYPYRQHLSERIKAFTDALKEHLTQPSQQ